MLNLMSLKYIVTIQYNLLPSSSGWCMCCEFFTFHFN